MSDITFTNTFNKAKATLQATKDFADWGKANSFTFELAAVNGAPMPASGNTATATQQNALAKFGEIEFSEAGTYEYTITERNDYVDGVSYDTATHGVVVTVAVDAATNELTASVKYDGKDSLIITNTFTAAEAKLEVTKDFADWGKADSFTFELAAVNGAPMPAAATGDTAVATKTTTKASFGKISYDKAGTYEYTIAEVNDGVDGVTYDTKAHEVVVTVKKDTATNALSVESIKYDGGDSLTITNTFTAADATLKATKDFADWGKANSFTFKLAAVDGAPMPAAATGDTAVATETTTTASFGKISYDKAGTYEYTITEVNDHAAGVTYDETPHHVVVTVAKDGTTNALSVESIKYDGGDSLTITNTFAATKTELKATKQFNDWGKAKSFTFNLEAVTKDAPMPANTTAVATEAAKTASFGEITYEAEGTYEYKITEVNDGVSGVTYDSAEHRVVVKVEANPQTNELKANVTYDGASALTIVNNYDSSDIVLQATKDFADWGKAKSFTFKLAAVTKDAPMPASDEAKATEANPAAAFGTITYEKAGTYEYTITETNDHVDGVTYDETAHKVVVTVEKNESGNLVATALYDGKDSLTITNTFAAADATLEATKDFADWGKANSFTFKLAAVTKDAPMPASDEAIATENAKTASFGTISFDKAGTYEYTITEVNDGVDGVTYDTNAHKAVVTVEKNEQTNELTANVKYDDDKDDLIITNTFAAADATLKATKDFADWGKADSFTFELAAVTENAPMPAVTTATATENAKTASFGTISYDKAGTYEYTITEVNGGVDGVTYDTKAHEVVVTVKKDAATNALSTEVKYDGEDSLTITNRFAAADATFKATKDFADWGKADSFTFKLAAVTKDAPMPASDEATATKDVTTASFGKVSYDKAGTYEYTITEVNDHAAGVTYDETPHQVVVTVDKDAATNKLTASVKYDGKDSLTITNTFAAAKTTLQATKQFNDWGKAKSFTFNLAAVTENAPMPAETTAVAKEDKVDAVFGEVTYETPGVYEYTITEVNDGADGVKYDTDAHKVVVTVTADKDTNELSAEVKYDGKNSLVITNTYASTKANLQVTKSFDRWDLATSFQFELAAVTKDAPMPKQTLATATEANPTAVFGEVEFEKTGKYEYTITEVDGGVGGVTYDTKKHKVVVDVTKDKDNKMTATVKYDKADALIVTNTYAATKATLEATKDFNDWGKADSFVFELKSGGSAPMPEGTVDGVSTAVATKGADTVNFGEITFEKEGTYEYTITEVKGTADGVLYDTTPHDVTVTVSKKDGSNDLVAAVDYDGKTKLTITNTFTATEAEIRVNKSYNGWGEVEQEFVLASLFSNSVDRSDAEFEFHLEAVTEDAPMPRNDEITLKNGSSSGTFGTMTFDKVGEYEYQVTEVNGGIDGISYDVTPHDVMIKVSKDADNQLSAEVIYDQGDDALEITNTFTAVTANVEVTKAYEHWLEDDAFTFNLKANTKDAPMPLDEDGNEITQVVATSENKTASFGEIEFEKTGVYEYEITEVNDGKGGITYDEVPHTVTITVTKEEDATNALSTTVVYDDDERDLIVTNTYAAEGKITFEGTKTYEGQDLKDGQFTFSVKENGIEVATGKALKDGSISFGEIAYTLDDLGSHTYTVSENIPSGATKANNYTINGVTYDPSVKTVVVEVTDNNDGTLKAEIVSDSSDKIAFKNSYSAKGQITLEGKKSYKNGTLKDGQFTFSVKKADGTEVSTGSVNADGNITFSPIGYIKTGEYTYYVTENMPAGANAGNDYTVDGVKYDPGVRKVVVEVADHGDGTLTAKVVSGKSVSITFANKKIETKKKGTKTGDNTPIGVLFGGLGIGVVGLAVLLYDRKRRGAAE